MAESSSGIHHTHTHVPLAPEQRHHLWITVISIWWMFSERSGPCVPQTWGLSHGVTLWLDETYDPGGPSCVYPPCPETYISSWFPPSPQFVSLSPTVRTHMPAHTCSSQVSTETQTATPGRRLVSFSRLYCLHLAWWMTGCLISPFFLQSQVLPCSLKPSTVLVTFFHTLNGSHSRRQNNTRWYAKLKLLGVYSSENMNNKNAAVVAANSPAEPQRTHSYTRHTGIRTRQLAHPSSLFLPQCARIFSSGCTMHSKKKNVYFSWGNTKEITTPVLPGSCQNNQCFPERHWCCDIRGEKAEGCRHSSGALVVDNKWGAVLGYVLQLSRLIIFDMHSGVYTVSSIKSSPATEGEQDAGSTHNAVCTYCAHKSAKKSGAGCCIAFSLAPSFVSPCPISYPRHNWRR